MTLERNIEIAFGHVLHASVVGLVRQSEAERLTLQFDEYITEEEALELLALLRRLVGRGEA